MSVIADSALDISIQNLLLSQENGRLRDALTDWRNCWLCPATDFDEQVSRLLAATDAVLGLVERQDAP